MIEKVLIANRGEIALRVHRACKEMGISTVAVHSTADENAMHVRLADESVCIGPPSATDSYLNIPAIISACEITGADAVHPGYGFLSENARFAEILAAHDITFIGPTADHINLMGDKIAAKTTVKDLGIPVVPGSDGGVTTDEEAMRVSKEIGFPVLVKAAAGGEPRHIEVQVIADTHGNVAHLGERDCSLQRRHQKVLEEAPSPALNDAARAEIGEIVRNAIGNLGYLGVGTIEFLYENGEFYFIEMNTRLQVEHPVTEAITGIDLVREQIRIAAGLEMSFTQEDVEFSGHAIECRINAEHPKTFTPSPGTIKGFHQPGGLGVRVDSGVYTGYRIPPYYDSLIGKLIVHGRDRNECLMRLRRTLNEFVIEGVDTTIPLFQELINEPDIMNGDYHIHWLEEFLDRS